MNQMGSETQPGSFQYSDFHDEVVEELSRVGNAKFGEAIRKDRNSQLSYLGIRFPVLRTRVKQGFSFTIKPPEEVLGIWDDLWKHSPWGDVLFAALEYYVPLAQKRKEPDLWPVLRHWTVRIDNWCHADQLSRVYSHILERQSEAVYPQMVEWNQSDDAWQRRISLVSLVHYSGKNAVFLPPNKVLPLVKNCLGDSRHYVQTAVGWVLREMAFVYQDEIVSFIEQNSQQFSATALSRTIEKFPEELRSHIRGLRLS